MNPSTDSTDSTKIRKILVISLSNLGDIILTTPVLAILRQHFPFAHLSVVAGPKGDELLRNSKTVDQVIIYDKKKMNWYEKFLWALNLRKEHYDLAIDLRNTLIPWIVGARLRNPPWFLKEPILMRQKHLQRLKFLGIEKEESLFHFYSETEKSSAYQKITALGYKSDCKLIAVAPGAGSYLKRWNLSRFSEVVGQLAREDRQIVIVGSAAEKPLGDQMVSEAHVINLCGILTLRELAAVLADTALLISNDSAIMHLGNELNVPGVNIFGPTNDQKYAKQDCRNRVIRKELTCAPCEKAHCRFERQACMEDISVDQVLSACEELLR